MMIRPLTICAITCCLLLPGSAGRAQDDEAIRTFNEQVLPILRSRCYECHSHEADEAKGGLMLDSRSGWEQGGDRGPAILPGSPEMSLLIQAVKYVETDLQMPPDGKLADGDIAILEEWIRRGAADPRTTKSDKPTTPANGSESDQPSAAHWAFQPLNDVPPPPVRDTVWPYTDVDHFILARLEQQQLRPVGDADRYTWLRRVTLDLTGLPPTMAEINDFLHDTSDQAYEQVVDRLLNSPAFGERWGRHWLDLVGYADQIGTANDLFAEHAWRYRDYVISSFNHDTPYNQFILEQLAGDQLPYDTVEQRSTNLIATGFLVLGDIAVVEADKDKLRVDVVDQQVEKVGKAFLGMTLGCARCHDHKFDPIPQRDYYAIGGFFYNTQSVLKIRWGVWSGITTLDLPETDQEQAERVASQQQHAEQLAAWQNERQQAIARRDELDILLKADPAAPAGEAAAGSEATPSKEALQKELDEKNGRIRQLDQLILHGTFFTPAIPRAFGVQDIEAPVDMQITVRGNAHVLGDQVPRGYLSAVKHVPAPPIPAERSGRQQLAEWIAHPANPLTARVEVNRIWQKLFGEGLVRSCDYFGVRGESPTHPELLDYLALEFARDHWSRKRLIRRLVLSHTYRLSSENNAAAIPADPQNRLLSRMNRWRLDAEALRDSVLAVSGQLAPLMGGPALPLEYPENVGNLSPEDVNPPSFRLARFRAGQEFQRSVYLPIIRSGPQPGPAEVRNVFDFTQPAQMAAQRSVTAVPTQALFLMNGPLLRARARDLAEQIWQRHALDEERLKELWLRVYNRPISGEEHAAARNFLTEVQAQLSDDSQPANEQRCWAELCHALLASSEFLMRL